ncbi:hypothetical protein C1S80_12400 [Mycolicibacterium aubagnense]|nr:hypothetical protein C1S80_12400 [Mycolicibacterium aubagnense]
MIPAWFRAHVLPAHGGTWDACAAALLADPLERRRIDELAVELKDGFDRPVFIGRDHWWSLRPRVLDGMHRSIAAMRAGIDIPIRYGYPDDDVYDHSDAYTITAVNAGPDKLLDAAMSLSSFRSAAGPWVQCDVGSAYGNVVRLQLPRHPQLREQIAAQLRGRLQAVGIDAQVAFAEDPD